MKCEDAGCPVFLLDDMISLSHGYLYFGSVLDLFISSPHRDYILPGGLGEKEEGMGRMN